MRRLPRQKTLKSVDIVTPLGILFLSPPSQTQTLTALHLKVPTPFDLSESLFHTDTWSIIIGILTFAVLVYQGYRWSLQYLEDKQRKLEQLIAERTEQLRLSDAKNKAILQALPDVIFRIGSDGTYLEFFSGSDFNSLVPPQKVLGKMISEVLPPAPARAVYDHIDRAHQTKETQSFQYELCRNGSSEYYEACVVALEHGESLAVVRDITARKQTEETLRDLESFRLIAEASPIAMGISRLSDGVILYANRQVEQILGLSNRELIGRKAPDFYYDLADRAQVMQALEQDGCLHQYELRVKKPDGAPFWILFSCQKLSFDGEPALLTGYYDITARKQAEGEFRRFNEELEQRVIARTQALQESEIKFRTLAEMATAGIFIYQGDKMCYVNPAATSISGYSQDELLRM